MTDVETARIADQLDRVVNGPAWLGPSLLDTLRGVDATDAAAHPQRGAHSIWEIVLHTTTWFEVVRQRLHDAAPARIEDDRDWPRVTDPGPERWQEAVAGLQDAAGRLRSAVLDSADHRLGDELRGADGTWSAYDSLHGVIQHAAYHAGQIVLLRKHGRTDHGRV